MDGFFEFPPPSEKSVAGNYQKSMDHAPKTRRETTLTEGNMDETNISAGENTENTSLRMFRKLEERLSVAQKSSEGTSDFFGFDITGTNVNESVNKKVSFREKREQQVDIAVMDFNKSKFQAADMPHGQASLNKGGSTSGRRATIFLNEDIECDPPQNLVDSNSKEFECKKLFPPEIQGKKNDPRRTQTFSGEMIDEDVDNIGSCERVLDKTREKSILNEASLPVLSLPETTPIPSKPRPTLLFKNGEPIESEGELSRSDARKGIEQNKSKLQTSDISLKQAQFKEIEKILTKRGTIFFHENNGMDFDLSNNVLDCDAVGSESINPTTSKSRPTMHFKKGEPIETEDDLDRSKAHRAHLQRMTFANEAENMEVESSLNYIDHPDKKIISAGNSVIKAINSQKAYSNETSEKRREQSSTLKEDFGISSKQPRFKTIDSELECVPIPLHSHARKGLVFQIDQRIQPSFEDTHKAAEESRSKAIGSGTNVRQTIFFNEAIGTSTEANVGKGSNQNRKTLHFSNLKMEIDQLLEPLSISGEEVDMKSSEMCRQNNARRTILQRADLDETHMVAQKNTSIFELFKAKNSNEINSSKSADNSNIRAPQMEQSDLTESTTNINTNSSGGQLNTFKNVIVPNSANKSHRPEPVANPRRTVIFNKESILEDSFGNNKSHTQPHQSFASSHFPNRNPECSQNSLKDIKRRETILVPVDMDESTDCLEKVNNSKAQNKELKSDRQQHSLAYHQQLDYSHPADIDLSLRESEQRNQSEVNNVAGTAEISMLQRRKSEQSVNRSSTNRSAAPSNEASYTQRPNRGTFVIYRDKEPVDGESPETSQASAKKGFENSSWTLSDNRPRLLRSARDSIYLSRTAQCPLIPGSLHTTTSSADFSANTTAALCNLDPNCITGAGYKRCFNKNYATEETVDKQLKYNGADNTMKLEIDGIQGDYDDIDKTQIDLVNSTLLDSSEKDELCEASVMIVETMNSEESSANSKKSMLEEKEKFLCRKCRNCQKTLNDTTLAEFRLKEEDEENLVINFDALKRLKGKPRFPDVLKEFKERRLSNSFNSTYEESVLLPLVPSTDFLLQNYSDEYMQKLEEESQLKSLVPAIYPVIRPFEYLFRNRLETEKCNWNFNNLHLPVGILECQHRKVRNIRLIIKFDRHDLYKANASQLQFNQVSMQKSNLYKNPSTFERVVQNEIFLQVPSDLTAFCSSSIDLFTFLETVDSICDKSYQLAKGLLKVTFSNRSSLQCNESGNCVVKKVVNNESNTATNGNRFEFLIRVRNIEKMCSDDIIMPPRSYFKDHVKTLPIGLAFLDKFLKSPDKYLL
ncbi:uncharacterized protein LOC119660595 [Hermetia illucens]|nr:uncharacterized protein LOC119660595 [Hermetia illucens]